MDLLITQEEIENFSDNPRERFIQIEQLCRRRHYAQIGNEEIWAIIRDARLRYMTTVIASAKYLNIDPIASIEVPRSSDWTDEYYEDFISDINFYGTQLMLEGADRKLKSAIFLEGSTRARLQTLVKHLREEVRKLDLPPARIDKILGKIEGFEKSLESRKLSYVTVGVVAFTVAGAIADVSGATSAVRDLINKIEEAVGQAKEQQDLEVASRLIEAQEPLKLMAPRREKPGGYGYGQAPQDTDDEIPF